MAIELPGEVVSFLNFIGVNWPQVNEDSVREFATHVRGFASDIEGTHQAASSTIKAMGASYSGSSYEQLVATWAHMSDGHMTELIDACNVVATALDIAADAIVVAKGVAIAELVGLAVSFVADQAAAVATFGLAEAAEALVIEAAKKCVNFLEQQLEQHILGEVVGKAVEPLESVVEKAVGGLVFDGTRAALGAGAGAGSSFNIIPDDLRVHAETLQGHADQVAGHAAAFASKVSAVSFE